MKFKSIAIVAVMGAALAGCQGGPKETFGGLTGAVAGGVIGSQIGSGEGRLVATAAGAALGALAGSSIGRMLDENDQRMAAEAQYRALEYGRSGAPVAWNNPDTGHYGQIVPTQSYTVNDLNCRDYTHTIYVDGQPQTARGRACRQSDGTWRPVN
ncbi:RT0821/Lpp0805 family surface protein [Cohaesibacter haloalkalitolerans]|jgi:surface antigen|uniref:RT0821/Lpp0805 family surface protein n=1 Tax=Cohaesibacter haloalkalitolerans TaxID=1162980 RepID=UPI000E64BF50|nr:RT0821/Lpp0805 family surface protein [Cohaesibacter haloalkalitolerans]